MFCSGCGQALEAGQAFCPKCGKPLAPSVPPVPGLQFLLESYAGKIQSSQHLLVCLWRAFASFGDCRADLCKGVLVRRPRPLDAWAVDERPHASHVAWPGISPSHLGHAFAAGRAGLRRRVGPDGTHASGAGLWPLLRRSCASSRSPSEPPWASGPWSCCSAIATPRSTTSSDDQRPRAKQEARYRQCSWACASVTLSRDTECPVNSAVKRSTRGIGRTRHPRRRRTAN